jgi:hypothetical protein
VSPDDPHPPTGELRAIQEDKADTESMRAIEAAEPAEQQTHERRAEKAAYLAEKLEEQAEALDE